jgi:restriction system-associated AAA family ATPase
MKLIKLKISEDFRGIKSGFKINFFDSNSNSDPAEFSPYCFVGRNGSGKSNILEALANIFYHIECIYLNYKPRSFEKTQKSLKGFDPFACSPNAFDLEYLIPVNWNKDKNVFNDESLKWEDRNYAHIKITKTANDRPLIEIVNYDWYRDIAKTPDRILTKQILPEIVIGYSSGENEVLSLPFFKMRFINFDEYSDILTKQLDYQRPEGRLIYVDSQYSQAILLANFLMQEKKFLKPFADEITGIGITGIEQVRIILQKHVYQKYKNVVIETFNIEDQTDKSKINVELTSLIRPAIDRLIKCCTIHHEDDENLTLDFWVDEDLKTAFKNEFLSPLDLFRTFQILHTLNLYEVRHQTKSDIYNSNSLYVNETVPILPSNKRVFRIKDFTVYKKGASKTLLTKSLSDGEHQYLHTMGICMLLRKSNVLFLLDEPETHFNPDWRSKFISTLKSCFKFEENTLRDILITTHSPFIISDCKQENVKWFVKENRLGPEKVTLNTYGTSIIKLMHEFYGKNRQIADLSWNEMLKDLKSESINDLNESLSKFGESFEKNMIIQKLNKLIIDRNLE